MTAQSPDLARIIARLAADMAHEPQRGRVADYIPALARADADRFGIAVLTADGQMHVGGDADQGFSIQSISKVFTLTMALNRIGARLWQRVGREPSGSAFNSIVQLEHEQGLPRNPFINAGAIVVSDVILAGQTAAAATAEILDYLRMLAGDPAIAIDAEVAASEAETGHRNAALASYIKSCGRLDHAVADVLQVYFGQCAITMSCRQLARAGHYLMAGGRGPHGEVLVPPDRARRINALMLTCGHYDGSGEFAYRVGIPGKSGVGGGILAVVPGRASIAVWSPGLNARGSSMIGSLALERLAEAMGWSVFAA